MTTAQPQSNNHGWLVAAGLVGFVLVIANLGKCSSPAVNTAQPFASPVLQNEIEALPTTQPIEALNAASVSRAFTHVRLAIAAEGFSGAMIYSQNCYDSLTHDFSWAKLDSCGAFDLLAVRSVDDPDASDLATEVSYFQPETAAARYLAAVTEAGEEAGKADLRLADVQRRAARMRPVVSRPQADTESVENSIVAPDSETLDPPSTEE